MKLYKLTDENGYTMNGTHWTPGTIHTLPEKRRYRLCSVDVLHAYESPLLAVLMNPRHGDFKNPLLFECEGEIVVSDGTKCGCIKLKVLKQIEIPVISTIQTIAFGILSALEVHEDREFIFWANNWLTGMDRSAASASAAYVAANVAAAAYDASAAAYDAAYAAYDAAYAAYAAAHAAASYAASAASYAASAASATEKINFKSIAEKAMEYK